MTAVNQDRPLVLLHVPHTGGTSLIYVMTDQVRRADYHFCHWDEFVANPLPPGVHVLQGHYDYCMIQTIMPDARVFLVVRDPIDRLISAYNYLQRTTDHPLHQRFCETVTCLEDFLFDPVLRDTVWNLQTRILGFDYPFADVITAVRAGEMEVGAALSEITRRRSEFYQNFEYMLLNAVARLRTVDHFALFDELEPAMRQLLKAEFDVEIGVFPKENATRANQLHRATLTEDEIFLAKMYNTADVLLYEQAVRIHAERFGTKHR
ncbi:MAG: sulfotransferase family 2 domain-containing protein [Alphaproteobacteria bacterium]|nr:sulfotransferase family 2 domain-containing protein [Alphaproteobacteria bacterium]